MLITPHSVAGAAIGASVNNPELAMLMSFSSHFILDRVPHWQEILHPYKLTWKTYLRIPVDLVISLILVAIIAHDHPGDGRMIWTCAVLAVLPDLDSLNNHLFKVKHQSRYYLKYYHWHNRLQRETASMWGVATQLAFSGMFLFLGLRG